MNTDDHIHKTEPAVFFYAVEAARAKLAGKNAECLARIPASELKQGYRCYAALDNRSGFAIGVDGEIANLFSSERGRGDALVAKAIELGGSHLNCFEGYLSDLYARHGFKEVGRAAFDWAYAPDGWLPEYGTPDVITLSKED